jgi:hypothetical protein
LPIDNYAEAGKHARERDEKARGADREVGPVVQSGARCAPASPEPAR